MLFDGSDLFITSEIAQVHFLELRSGKKLPPIPNYGNGQIIVLQFDQSKNRSSPNP